MKTMTLLIVLCLAGAGSASGGNPFYYGGDGPIYLTFDSTAAAVKFNSEVTSSAKDSIASLIHRSTGFAADLPSPEGFEILRLTTAQNYLGFLDSLRNIAEILSVEPYYRTQLGAPIVAGDELCIGFKTGTPQTEIDSLFRAWRCEIVRENEFHEFVVRMPPDPATSILDVANQLHMSDQTEYAQPNFAGALVPFSYNLYDYYSNHQLNIKLVIGTFNQASVWDFAGLTDSIVVAIIDDGVRYHEDLPARVPQGLPWVLSAGCPRACPGFCRLLLTHHSPALAPLSDIPPPPVAFTRTFLWLTRSLHLTQHTPRQYSTGVHNPWGSTLINKTRRD